MNIGLHVLVFVVGAFLAVTTVVSAVKTFVLPRSAPVRISRVTFLTVRFFFNFYLKRSTAYDHRDGVMALFAPFSLLILEAVWLGMVQLGYTAMFWAIGIDNLETAYLTSGSCLLTLGFAGVTGLAQIILAFSEATIGLVLVALLISYLPTMYGAFSKREESVTMLSVRAGSPPSPIEMLARFQRIGRLELALDETWTSWEVWFVDVDESHTSLSAINFFRSPQPEHSWLRAAEVVMDAAALSMSVVDVPRNYKAALCLRSGFVALRRIATFFRIPHNPDPNWNDPISITRRQFDEACLWLEDNEVPLKADREQAWRDFAGWRVNYDSLIAPMARLVMAPERVWIPPRPLERPRWEDREGPEKIEQSLRN